MNANSSARSLILWHAMSIGLLALLLALLTPGVALADHCLDDPLNAADCMRTPLFREMITIILVSLGVGPVVLNNILQSLAGGSPLLDTLSNLGKDLFEALKKAITSIVARRTGSQLAANTANILKQLSQPATSGPSAPPKQPPPKPAPKPKPRWAGPVKDRIQDGVKAKNTLKDLNVLNDLRNLDPNDKDYWKKMDRILDKARDSNRKVKGITFKHKVDKDGNKIKGVDEDNIVIVVEEPEYGPYTPPTAKKPTVIKPKQQPSPPKPPKPKPKVDKKKSPGMDIKQLQKLRQLELLDAQRRFKKLNADQQKLARDYKKLYVKWQYTRGIAPVEGAIDIADFFLKFKNFALNPKPPGPYLKTIGKTYAKISAREALKDLFRAVMKWRTGYKGKDFSAYETLLEKPVGYRNPYKPGGIIKKVVELYTHKKQMPIAGPLSTAYSFFQRFSSVVKHQQLRMAQVEAMRKQMSAVHQNFNRVTSQLETAQQNLEIARSGLKDVNRAIEELKRASPRFKNL